VSPAKPTLIDNQYDDVGTRSGGKVEQVNQARLAHIGGNELGSEFDSIDEKSQITRSGSTKTNLLREDVSRQGTTNRQRTTNPVGGDRKRTE